LGSYLELIICLAKKGKKSARKSDKVNSMKLRPWLTVYILMALSMGIISTIPLEVTAQEDDLGASSWDIYQTTWTQINYQNISTIWIQHPVNGSLVSNNQKLNFIVVPFDVDEMLYKIDVYKNDILMYTCNREQVYDLNIYTTNAVNNVVTIIFTLNSKEVLRLEYYAILLIPSMAEDVTEMWLAYQAERYNQTMSGRELVSRRDQEIMNINLVVTTGFSSLLLAGIAIFFVLLFQIIRIVNFFSIMVWFGSGIIWLNSMTKIDNWMRSLLVATPDDVFVYYARIITITLIVVIANLFYFITYKATSTRLARIEYESIDKMERTKTKYDAVIGRKKGKLYWRLQDSWSALRRVLFRADYEIEHEGGNINETYRVVRTKATPENIDIRKPIRTLKRATRQIFSRITFHVKDKDTDKIQPTKEKTKKYDWEIWKRIDTSNPFASPTPTLVLDGEPDFRREYEKQTYDNIVEEMKAIAKESSDPKFIKNIQKRIKRLEKRTKKPKKYVVNIKPANKDAYSIEDYLIDAKTLDKLSKLVNKLKDEKHKLEAELIVKGYETGEDIFSQFDKAIKEFEESMPQGSA